MVRERRRSPRPPLWLNLLLLVIAVTTFAWAREQRQTIREKTSILFHLDRNDPAELDRIRDELSTQDLTREQLSHELDARLKFLQSVNSSEFYIAIDTAKRRFYFRLGNDVVREADITIGEAKTITAPGGSRRWTFVPEKGAFAVVGKESDYMWPVPPWVYAMRGEPAPATPQQVMNGLGRYVIVLPDNYVIHSTPPDDSPLRGMAKPGSIMVPEADLEAIWPRISTQTRVYIF